MRPHIRLPARASSQLLSLKSNSTLLLPLSRALHNSAPDPANVSPFYATGPPPEAPQPAPEHPYAKIERRRKQAELLKKAKELRNASSSTEKGKSPLRKRFWDNAYVKEVDGSYQIHLDSRPLKHPTSKETVTIPLTKPLLAHALALEWDLITSAQQATRQHLIPLTSLICRALDLAADDAAATSGDFGPIRTSITTVLMRYLDTDSLLCWAPPPDDPEDPSLRKLQEEVAGGIIGHLCAHVWPGVEIEPVLDERSILPTRQKAGVREVIQGWVMGLDAWELIALERSCLAGKSLLGGVRLVVEWSEGAAGRAGREIAAAQGLGDKRLFGVDEAARAASLEVDWQTKKWGEVEDTHDVEKEDLRRQLGSAILLVSGTSSD